MKNEEVEKLLYKLFTHVGIVRNIDLMWVEEGVFSIKATVVPWSETKIRDVTQMFLDSDMIVDDSYIYLQLPKPERDVTATLAVNIKDPDWQKNLARQFGYIIVAEMKTVLRCYE